MSGNTNVKSQLAQARQAYHDLQTGRMARVVVDQNGERVEFTPTNKSNLYAYIQQLEALVPCDGGMTLPNVGPAGFIF